MFTSKISKLRQCSLSSVARFADVCDGRGGSVDKRWVWIGYE